jgi:hypothetical protein
MSLIDRQSWRGRASIALVVALVGLGARPASADTNFTVLLDLDNNTATGCTVATADGPFPGVEQRLITTVATTTNPMTVVAVVRQVCIAGPPANTFGPNIPVNSPFNPPWPVGNGNGTGGFDVIETYFPLAGVAPGVYRLGFISSLVGGGGGDDALTTTDGGQTEIVIASQSLREIPTLGGWGLLGLALLLLGAGHTLLRRRRTLAGSLLALLLLTAGVGAAFATLTPDGDPSDWAAIPPLATDAPPPSPVNLDIGTVFGTIANGDLLLRIDANLDAPPTAVADTYTGVIGNVPFSVGAGAGLSFNDTDPDGGPLTVTTGTFATTQGGSVTIAADGSFTYRSPLGFEGADTFNYTVSDGSLTAIGTATVNVNEVVWFIDSAAAPGGTGRFEAPFQTVAAFNAIQGAGAAPAQADDFIFIQDRGGVYAGAIALLAGQRLWGSGEALVVGATTVLPATVPSHLKASSASTVTLSTGNQIRGITIENTAGSGIAGTSFGTLLVRTSSVAVAGGRALDLATGTLDAQFVNVSSNSSPNEGSLLATVGGTLSISGTYTATSPTTDGLKLTSSNVATTIALVSITSTLGHGIDLVGGTGLFDVEGGTIDLVGKIGLQAASRTGGITLKNVLVKRTGNNAVAAQESHGVKLRECTGTVLVQNCGFTDMRDNDPGFFTDNNGVDLVNTTGTLPGLTIDSCAFAGTAVALNATTTDHGARIILDGTARITAVSFTNNTASFLDGSAIQVLLDPDDSGDTPSIGTLAITDNPSIQTQGWGVEIRVDGFSTLPNFHVDRNKIFGDNTSFPTPGFTTSGGILFDLGEFIMGVLSTASATGTISDNDIDNLGDGSFDRGIDVLSQDNTAINVTLNGNKVDGTTAEAITLRSFDTSRLTAKLTNSVVAATRKVILSGGAGALQSTSDQTSVLCLRITGNSVGIAPSTIGLNSNGSSILKLDGISPATPSAAQVVAFVAPLNPAVTTVSATSGGGTFGTCTIP